MKKHLLFLVVFLICLLGFIASYFSFHTTPGELNFISIPTFEEEGFIVKPSR